MARDSRKAGRCGIAKNQSPKRKTANDADEHGFKMLVRAELLAAFEWNSINFAADNLAPVCRVTSRNDLVWRELPPIHVRDWQKMSGQKNGRTNQARFFCHLNFCHTSPRRKIEPRRADCEPGGYIECIESIA
jgi:hypothetical protein